MPAQSLWELPERCPNAGSWSWNPNFQGSWKCRLDFFFLNLEFWLVQWQRAVTGLQLQPASWNVSLSASSHIGR